MKTLKQKKVKIYLPVRKLHYFDPEVIVGYDKIMERAVKKEMYDKNALSEADFDRALAAI